MQISWANDRFALFLKQMGFKQKCLFHCLIVLHYALKIQFRKNIDSVKNVNEKYF